MNEYTANFLTNRTGQTRMSTKNKNPAKLTNDTVKFDTETIVGQLRLQIRELKETIRRLNDECRVPRMTEQELQEGKRLREEHARAYSDINALALWLRTNKAQEISRGDHNGRTLADVVIGYLAKSLQGGGSAQ